MIAILGASSQIAKDLIRSIAAAQSHPLILYARDISGLEAWLVAVGLAGRFDVLPYSVYGQSPHDAVINFVGIGDPSRAAAMGNEIYDITLEYDQLVLKELHKHPERRYIFLSSGAAYGNSFLQPVDESSQASIAINALTPQDCYAVAKLHAECRHRSMPQLAITDLRVFNYFSRTQDMRARFFITDIIRAIQTDTVLQTSPNHMLRDYLHPSDFYQLIDCVLKSPAQNTALDCYSQAPIDKNQLLSAMAEKFGLRFEITPSPATQINATGAKPYYYSLNHKAASIGYTPAYSSLDTVLTEAAAVLGA